MAELIPAAGEAEWLAARQKGITASEIAVIMGLAPESYGSAYNLYHQKLGILPPDDQTPEMEFGTFCEPYIAGKFVAAHPEIHVYGDGRTLYRHSERPWQMATPDRLLAANIGYDIDPAPDDYSDVGLRAVAEFKTDGGSDEWGEPGTDEIPVHYRCQVIWQMDVMGVSRAYVACLGRDRKVREYVVEMDEAARRDLKLMLTEARDFLDRIDEKNEPEIDWRPATADALKKLHPSVGDYDVPVGRQLEISYRAAARRYKEAERRRDEMTNRLRKAMGSAHRAVTPSGEVIARRDVYEVRESVRKGYTVDKLVHVPPKTKKES